MSFSVHFYSIASVPQPKGLCMKRSTRVMVDAASWYCAIVLWALILLASVRETSLVEDEQTDQLCLSVTGTRFMDRPCDEIYVVGEGETLHTISDKCGDPFIVERNPHIHDPDDVFPGLVIKITPTKMTRK